MISSSNKRSEKMTDLTNKTNDELHSIIRQSDEIIERPVCNANLRGIARSRREAATKELSRREELRWIEIEETSSWLDEARERWGYNGEYA